MRYFIYMLFDNLTQQPLYVGATKLLKARFSTHRGTTLKNYSNIAHVTMDVLEEANDENVVALEQYWYYQIKSWGFPLLQQDCKLYRMPKVLPFNVIQIGVLADAFKRSRLTIERWIEAGDDRLTSDKAKKALQKSE